MMEFLLAHINWVAVSLSIIGIFLNANKMISCWPVWIASNICWLVYVIPKNEGAEIVLWSVFALANAYGWYQWLKKEDRTKKDTASCQNLDWSLP
ncbi:MAG: nicotinamide mononucleotide transporter [bacterium]|nr:nicotinamide mononucleotide transporter [bacterium]